jgi:hypothetical protein
VSGQYLDEGDYWNACVWEAYAFADLFTMGYASKAKAAESGAIQIEKEVAKAGTKKLLPGVVFKSSHALMKHGKFYFGLAKDCNPTKAQIEVLKNFIKRIYREATVIKQGVWFEYNNALFYTNGRHVVVTQSDGTFVTILHNATENKKFKQAVLIWQK